MNRLVYTLIFIVMIRSMGFSQVNLQSGAGVINIPIYSFQDNKSRLSFPVALGYNGGSGLKVDEVATDVGQGWGLMAGGKIARVQIGEPDDQKALGDEGTNENAWNVTKYPAGYLYTSENAANGAPREFAKYPVFPKQNMQYTGLNSMNADREADQFVINVNGISATFILKKSLFNVNTGIGEGVFLGNTLMKIKYYAVLTPTQSFTQAGVSGTARTTINKFVLTDENGIAYHFESKTYNKVLRLAPSDRRFSMRLGQPKKYKKREVYHETFFEDDNNNIPNPYIVTEWHLTKIEDQLLNTSRAIELQYTYRNLTQWIGFDYTTQNTKKDYGKVVARKAMVVAPVISLVTCPNGYSIQIGYGEQRLDVPGSNRLKTITVNYGSRVVQRHELKHTYVIYTRYGMPVTTEQKLASRLYLIGLTRYTAYLKDIEKPYVFDYYLGGSNNTDFVPPPYFASKDIWGYYDGCLTITGGASTVSADFKAYCVNGSRGDISTEFPSFDEIKRLSYKEEGLLTRVKDGYAKNGLLKLIQYPAGASMKYEYEQRKGRFMNESDEHSIGGVQVSKTILYDGGYSNGCATPGIVTNYSYKNEDGASSLWGAERPVNYYEAHSEYRAYDRKFKYNILAYKSKCDWGYQYPGIQYADQANHISGFSAAMSSQIGENLSSALSVWGTLSNIRTIVSVASNTAKFSVVAAWVGIGLDILVTITDIYMGINSCTMNTTKESTTRIWYNRDLKASNSLPVMYKRVEVSIGDGSNGKTIHEFTSTDDYPLWVDNAPLFSMQQRYGPWHYGLPKRTIVRDKDGRKVHEVINTYSNGPDTCSIKGIVYNCNVKKQPLHALSCNIRVLKAKPVRSTDWEGFKALGSPEEYTTQSLPGELAVNMYDYYTGYLELLSTEELKYEQGNDNKWVTKNTIYQYKDYFDERNNYLPVSKEEIVTGQNSVKAYYIYNNEVYTAPGTEQHDAMQRQLSTGIINIPVETKVMVKRPFSGEEYKYVSASNTSFAVNASGLVLPKYIKARRVANPVSNINSITPVTVAEMRYDNAGILKMKLDEGGRHVTYLYGYDDQLVVAEVINAGVVANQPITYSSFEEGVGEGFTATGQRIAGTSITGTRYYQLTPSAPINLSFANSPVEGRLSFWSTQPVSVSNAQLLAGSPVRKGYTFYQYKVAAQVGQITISGTSSIDELRLIPFTARMHTTAYDPLIGKLTGCGADNRFVSYEYDTRGRLKAIKDEEGSIVKSYDYGEKQKRDDCTGTYQSHAVYEVIRKNNCAPGYAASYVEYYLPEGAFTSTISQEHADLLAEKSIQQNGQNYANTNGTCKAVYNSAAVQKTFYKDDCPVGQKGTAYVYAVPAGRYSSTISQQDADDQANEEVDDMGQDAANLHGGCTTDNSPRWEGDDESSQTRCVNGVTQVYLRDVNPNSPTYNQWQWFELEENIQDCVPEGGTATQLVYQGPSSPEFIINFLDISTGQNHSFSTHGPMGIYGELGPLPAGLYRVSFYPTGGSSFFYYVLDTFESPYGLWAGNGYGYTEINGVHISGNNPIVVLEIY